MPVPAVGSKLPDFTLPYATKESRSEFHLEAELAKLGKGSLVIGFFPLAFSGTCTKEMCDFRDNLGQFEGKGARVVGFSTDSAFANHEFAKVQGMAQGIVSDPNRAVVDRIWETMTVAGVQHVAKRGAMVVGADGLVQWTSISQDPTVWVGTEEVRKHL